MSPWLGITIVLTALSVVMGVMKALGRFVAPEISRKTVHVVMGLVMLGLPWIFTDVWPVVVLCVCALAGLSAVRFVPIMKREMGDVLGGVERKTWGEFYFPVAVTVVFYLSEGDAILYCIPILIMTLADTAGALVGVFYGVARYRTDDGHKTAEGSLAFFTTAFLSCHIPLLLFTETGRAETLLVSLTAGFVVMLLEAVAWRGQDNLILPVGMFVLLKLFLPLTTAELLVRFGVILGLVAVVTLLRKRTTLSDSAVLVCALSAYAVWGFWRWTWLLPLMLLFVVYVGLPRFPGEARPMQNFHAVTRVMAGAFFWMMAQKVFPETDTLAPFFLCVSAHAGNIVSARMRAVKPEWSLRRVALVAWCAPTVLFGMLAIAWFIQGRFLWWFYLQLPVAIALSLCLFIPLWPFREAEKHPARQWFSETCVAVLASCVGLL